LANPPSDIRLIHHHLPAQAAGTALRAREKNMQAQEISSAIVTHHWFR
jgi:hypothetical protein